jgi:Na+/H+ antiporter NhaD/arsenite permease-like protein
LILFAVFITDPPFLREGLMLLAAIGSYLTTSKSVHQANHFNFHPIQEVAILFVGIFATMMPALDWLQANASKMGQPSPAFFYWGSGIISSALDNAPTYLAFLSAILGAFVDEKIISQVQHLVQNGGVDLAAVAQPIQETYLALYKYHGEHLASKNISVEEIKIAFLLGNASFNNYVLAISIGAVFFGANTYIGNGPNFMVKSIADHSKVHSPSFLGYVCKYTLPYMVPVLIIVWWFFFRT